MDNLIKYLSGGDLRSIANVNEVVSLVKTKSDFEELFKYLFSKDRLIVMRAADAIEKLTIENHGYLNGYNEEIIDLLEISIDKEFKWHLALISSRLDLTKEEFGIVWNKLKKWATDKKESKIVRVNSIQALFDLSNKNIEFKRDFDLIIQNIKVENTASISARLRKLKIE